jgi:hypothetical protein
VSVTPIRGGIEPGMDVERELIAFATEHIVAFTAECGEPQSIAFVIIGKEQASVSSWTPGGERSVGETCGYAAALLLKKAAQ